jgi:hypothetical protein
METEKQSLPPILAYSGPRTKDPRAKWILPGYSIGLLGTGFTHGLAVACIERTRASPGDSLAGLSALVEAVAFSLILGLFPGNILLGLTMWAKRKIFRDVRFARMRWAIIAGAVAGALPLQTLTLEGFVNNTRLAILVALGWYFFVPVFSGFLLCYRSALRD